MVIDISSPLRVVLHRESRLTKKKDREKTGHLIGFTRKRNKTSASGLRCHPPSADVILVYYGSIRSRVSSKFYRTLDTAVDPLATPRSPPPYVSPAMRTSSCIFWIALSCHQTKSESLWLWTRSTIMF